jgi:hypothetical protein
MATDTAKPPLLHRIGAKVKQMARDAVAQAGSVVAAVDEPTVIVGGAEPNVRVRVRVQTADAGHVVKEFSVNPETGEICEEIELHGGCDAVSTDDLRMAVERIHGVSARFVESVEVDERFEGDVVWQGVVKVFDLAEHASGARRAYAWSYRAKGTREYKAILGIPPVDGPSTAVRASIMAERQPAKT